MAEIAVSDDEIESLMAELEAESAKIVGAQADAKPVTPKKEVPAGPSPAEIAEGERQELLAIKAAAEKKKAQAERGAQDTTIVVPAEKTPPWEDESASEAVAPVKAVPDFIKKLQKPKPEPVEFEDVPDLDALKAERQAKTSTIVMTVKVDATDAIAALAAVTEPDLIPSEDMPKTSENSAAGRLQNFVDPDKFRTDTRVTEASLDACMIEQNGLRAFYGAQAARAEAQASRMKARFEVIEATMYEQHRKAFAASGEKTTVQMVDSAVKTDPRWIKAKNTVIEAESIAAINKAMVESLRDRASMIMQLSANRRDEYKGQSRVLEERDERNELRERALAAAQRGV